MATEQVRFAPQQDTERKRHHQSSRSVVEVLRLPGPRHPHHGVVKEDIPQAEQRIRRKERAVEMLEHRDEDLGDLYTEIGQTLQGWFSAVSTPIFASKYSLESSRRDLHNALLCTVLYCQIFV